MERCPSSRLRRAAAPRRPRCQADTTLHRFFAIERQIERSVRSLLEDDLLDSLRELISAA